MSLNHLEAKGGNTRRVLCFHRMGFLRVIGLLQIWQKPPKSQLFLDKRFKESHPPYNQLMILDTGKHGIVFFNHWYVFSFSWGLSPYSPMIESPESCLENIQIQTCSSQFRYHSSNHPRTNGMSLRISRCLNFHDFLKIIFPTVWHSKIWCVLSTNCYSQRLLHSSQCPEPRFMNTSGAATRQQMIEYLSLLRPSKNKKHFVEKSVVSHCLLPIFQSFQKERRPGWQVFIVNLFEALLRNPCDSPDSGGPKPHGCQHLMPFCRAPGVCRLILTLISVAESAGKQ